MTMDFRISILDQEDITHLRLEEDTTKVPVETDCPQLDCLRIQSAVVIPSVLDILWHSAMELASAEKGL